MIFKQILSPLEERLVSLRLPFCQIRLKGSEQQYSLLGNVVNVPTDVNEVCTILPRPMNNVGTIQVQLMRKMSYQRPYMFETVRPAVLRDAMAYLVSTDLYKSQGVQLSTEWQNEEASKYTNILTIKL